MSVTGARNAYTRLGSRREECRVPGGTPGLATTGFLALGRGASGDAVSARRHGHSPRCSRTSFLTLVEASRFALRFSGSRVPRDSCCGRSHVCPSCDTVAPVATEESDRHASAHHTIWLFARVMESRQSGGRADVALLALLRRCTRVRRRVAWPPSGPHHSRVIGDLSPGRGALCSDRRCPYALRMSEPGGKPCRHACADREVLARYYQAGAGLGAPPGVKYRCRVCGEARVFTGWSRWGENPANPPEPPRVVK